MSTPVRVLLGLLVAAAGGCDSSSGDPGAGSDAMGASDAPSGAGSPCFLDAGGTAPVLATTLGDAVIVVGADGSWRTLHTFGGGSTWRSLEDATVVRAGERLLATATLRIDDTHVRNEATLLELDGTVRWSRVWTNGSYPTFLPGPSGAVAVADGSGATDGLLVEPDGTEIPLGELDPAAAPSVDGWLPVARPTGDGQELGWRRPDGTFEALPGSPWAVRWAGPWLVGLAGSGSSTLVIAKPGEAARTFPVTDDAWNLGATNGDVALLATFVPATVYRVALQAGTTTPVELTPPEGAHVSGSEYVFVVPAPGLAPDGALRQAYATATTSNVYTSTDGAAWTPVGEPFAIGPLAADLPSTPGLAWLDRGGTTLTWVASTCEGCPPVGTMHVVRDGETLTVDAVNTSRWYADPGVDEVLSADGACLAYHTTSETRDVLHVLSVDGGRTEEVASTPLTGAPPMLGRAHPVWLR